MTEPLNPSQKVKPTSVRFLDFWQLMAADLGTSRLRINQTAETIHELVDNDSDARIYLRDAIKKSYKLSKCQHLGSPICLEMVLDILGETAYQLRGDQADDLFDIELLEEIAWHICNRYSAYLDCLCKTEYLSPFKSTTKGLITSPKQRRCCAQVVSFPNYKIRKANERL